MAEFLVTAEFLDSNPNMRFVFGDNHRRVGHGGAAILRGHKQAIGVVTKKAPTHNDWDYYRPNAEFFAMFGEEMTRLRNEITAHPEIIYLISRLGAGLANKYGIWRYIEPKLLQLRQDFTNVKLLWLEQP